VPQYSSIVPQSRSDIAPRSGRGLGLDAGNYPFGREKPTTVASRTAAALVYAGGKIRRLANWERRPTTKLERVERHVYDTAQPRAIEPRR
jgi:hypothetical protein